MTHIATEAEFFSREPSPENTIGPSPYQLVYHLGQRVQALAALTARVESLELAMVRIISLLPVSPTGNPVAPDPRQSIAVPRPDPDPTWIPVLHRPKVQLAENPAQPGHTHDILGCGLPALYLTRPFTQTEKADISAIRVCFPNEREWRQPKPNDISLCSGCGAPVDAFSDRDLDYSPVLIPTPQVVKLPRKRRRSPAKPADFAEGMGSDPPTRTLDSVYTPEAQAEVLNTLDWLENLAKDAGVSTPPSYPEDWKPGRDKTS